MHRSTDNTRSDTDYYDNRGVIIDVIKDRSNTMGVEWKTVAILVTTAILLVRKGYIILIEN